MVKTFPKLIVSDNDNDTITIKTAKQWADAGASYFDTDYFPSKLALVRIIREVYSVAYKAGADSAGHSSKKVYNAYLIGNQALLVQLNKLIMHVSMELADAAIISRQSTKEQHDAAVDTIFNHVDSGPCTCAHCKDKQEPIRPMQDGDIFSL